MSLHRERIDSDASPVVKRPSRKTCNGGRRGRDTAGIHPLGHINVSPSTWAARNTSEPWHFSRGGHEEEAAAAAAAGSQKGSTRTTLKPSRAREHSREERDPWWFRLPWEPHSCLLRRKLEEKRRESKSGTEEVGGGGRGGERKRRRRRPKAEAKCLLTISLVNIGRLLGIRARREQGYPGAAAPITTRGPRSTAGGDRVTPPYIVTGGRRGRSWSVPVIFAAADREPGAIIASNFTDNWTNGRASRHALLITDARSPRSYVRCTPVRVLRSANDADDSADEIKPLRNYGGWLVSYDDF